MAQEDLDALKGKYPTEPIKRKRVAKSGGGFELVPTPDWTLNSRMLLVHLFFNVLGEKAPRNVPKGKLPSIDAEALEAMNTPIAAKLSAYRSMDKTLKSIENATSFVYPAAAFGQPGHEERALLRFNPLGYDNVERVFSVAGRSIPINVDKRARNAFTVPTQTVSTADVMANPKNAALLAPLFVTE